MPRKYISDPSQVLEYERLHMDVTLSYDEQLVAIMDRQVKRLRNREIVSAKILWKNHTESEAIWIFEEDKQARYSHILNLKV
ncbi:unnamed protein product [Rhodiola kirilowii]